MRGQQTPSIQSLDRGLVILETVAKSPDPVSLDKLAELLGIDRSSVYRLANTLKRRGFLVYPAGGKDYILGPSIWRLSRQYDWSNMLIKVSHDHLNSLASRTNETAHLAVREGKHALFIDHATTRHVIAVAGQTGELVPLYCTAHGKALLADFSKRELTATFGTAALRAYTKHTIVSLDRLAKACAEIKDRGYATDGGEFHEELRCVAAPIRDQEGAVIGSIGISAPLTRLSKEDYRACCEQVLEVAREIHEMLCGQAQEA